MRTEKQKIDGHEKWIPEHPNNKRTQKEEDEAYEKRKELNRIKYASMSIEEKDKIKERRKAYSKTPKYILTKLRYNNLNKNKLLLQSREYKLKNKALVAIKQKEYRRNNSDKMREYNASHRKPQTEEQKLARNARTRQLRILNPMTDEQRDAKNLRQQLYREKNPPTEKQRVLYKNKSKLRYSNMTKDQKSKLTIRSRELKCSMPKELKIIANEIASRNKKNRYDSDILYRTRVNVRSLIKMSFKSGGYSKSSTTFKILGCDFNDFMAHIESKFEPWMNWGNKGGKNITIDDIGKFWDYDHIIPLCSAKSKDEIIKLNHYTNFQPLCSYTNRWIKNGTENWLPEQK